MQERPKLPIRVLIAKAGLDGHERGARVVSLGLRDEGMEVIYLGIRQTVEAIVEAAAQENVDVVGLSSLSGAHDLFPEVVDQLRKKGLSDVLVIGGGIIPDEDIELLKEKGISAIFGPGTRLNEVADYIRKNVRSER